MNHCAEFELLISMQLDDMLTGEEASALEQHLITCPACRSLQAELTQLYGDLGALSAEPPASLVEKTAARIREYEQTKEVAPPVRARSFAKYRSFFASAAVFAVLLGAVAFGQTGMSGGGNNSPIMANEESNAQMRDITYAADGGEAATTEEEIADEFESSVPAPQEAPGTNEPAPPTEEADVMPITIPISVPICGYPLIGTATEFDLAEGDALTLLAAFLKDADGNPNYGNITCQRLDEEAGNYLFLVTFPDESQAIYSVNANDGSILCMEDTL